MAEFNMANAITTEDTITEEQANTDPKTHTSEKPVINQKITDIDISDLSKVIFVQSDGRRYEIRTKNMIRIAKMVITSSHKSVFLA